MRLAQDDEVVDALASDRADQPFGGPKGRNEATSSRPREHRSEARPRRPASSLRSHLISDRDNDAGGRVWVAIGRDFTVSAAEIKLDRHLATTRRLLTKGRPELGRHGLDDALPKSLGHRK